MKVVKLTQENAYVILSDHNRFLTMHHSGVETVNKKFETMGDIIDALASGKLTPTILSAKSYYLTHEFDSYNHLCDVDETELLIRMLKEQKLATARNLI